MLCEVWILPAAILKKEKWLTITDHHVHFMIEALEKCNLKVAQNCLKVPSKEASLKKFLEPTMFCHLAVLI